MCLPSVHCGKISREILQGLCRTGIDAHLEQDVPLLARWALNRDCQFRFFSSSVKMSVECPGPGEEANTSFAGGSISR
jgi:hypothetical protein